MKANTIIENMITNCNNDLKIEESMYNVYVKDEKFDVAKICLEKIALLKKHYENLSLISKMFSVEPLFEEYKYLIDTCKRTANPHLVKYIEDKRKFYFNKEIIIVKRLANCKFPNKEIQGKLLLEYEMVKEINTMINKIHFYIGGNDHE